MSPSSTPPGNPAPRHRTRPGGSKRDFGGPESRGDGGTLPRWVTEALTRVTAPERVRPALVALEAAADAFEAGAFDSAYGHAVHAKSLSPRDATIREMLGLAAYRLGDWETALRELRTFRRLAGDPQHLPIEFDCLRGLDRPTELDALWSRAGSLDLEPWARVDGAVVYASALIDQGRLEEASRVLESVDSRQVEEYRRLELTYVAARLAALRGAAPEARRLRAAILEVDPSYPGMRELDDAIAAD